ncbi:MAG: prepilin-type N-terminal cleavage/methylation domain-containing protein, partial [Patescibacteria group bacterium]
MKNLKKGFTLIELLVVVAIIGILASVVLGS